MNEDLLPQIAQILNLSEKEVIGHPHFLINAFDQDHRVLFWNQKCERYFGITQEYAIGELLEELIPYVGNNHKMKLLDSALSGKTVFVAEDQYDKTNARYTQMVIPLKNSGGEVVAALNIVSDIPQPASKLGVYGRLIQS